MMLLFGSIFFCGQIRAVLYTLPITPVFFKVLQDNLTKRPGVICEIKTKKEIRKSRKQIQCKNSEILFQPGKEM